MHLEEFWDNDFFFYSYSNSVVDFRESAFRHTGSGSKCHVFRLRVEE